MYLKKGDLNKAIKYCKKQIKAQTKKAEIFGDYRA